MSLRYTSKYYMYTGNHTGFFVRGGGDFVESQKTVYIIWSSHDRETVKQISDET